MLRCFAAAACRYGELQGLNKAETADKFGADTVKQWRRSYDIPPPNGESLQMTAERAVAYFKAEVRGAFQGKRAKGAGRLGHCRTRLHEAFREWPGGDKNVGQTLLLCTSKL